MKRRIMKMLAVAIAFAMVATALPMSTGSVMTVEAAKKARKVVKVTTQEELDAALADSSVKKIKIKTDAKLTFRMPEGNYAKKIVVNAPNATIQNSGVFKNVKAVDASKWVERAAGNKITVGAESIKVVVKKDASVESIGFTKKDATVEVKIQGEVKDVVLETAVNVNLTGDAEKVTVEVKKAAEGSTIKSEVAVDITADAVVFVELEKGAENSTVTTTDESIKIAVKNESEAEVTITTPEGETKVESGETTEDDTAKEEEKDDTSGTGIVVVPSYPPYIPPTVTPPTGGGTVDPEPEEPEEVTPLNVVGAEHGYGGKFTDDVMTGYSVELDGTTIKLTATDLTKHENSAEDEAYWIGFKVELPEGTTSIQYAWDNDTLANLTVDGSVSAYVQMTANGVANHNKFTVKVGEVAYEYTIDVTGVTLYEEEPEEVNPFNVVGAEHGYNGKVTADVMNNYSVVLDGTTIKLSATDLKEHNNAAGIPAYWIGFKVELPEGTTNIQYAWDDADLADLTVDGSVSAYVQMTANGVANHNKFTVKVGDDTYEYTIDVTGVTLYEEEPEEVTPLNVVDAEHGYGGKFTVDVMTGYSVVLDGTTIKLSATDLKEHNNAAGIPAYWIGFKVELPEGTTNIQYAWDDADLADLTVDGSVSAYVQMTANSVANHNKFTVKVGDDTYEYTIDVSGVTLAADTQ